MTAINLDSMDVPQPPVAPRPLVAPHFNILNKQIVHHILGCTYVLLVLTIAHSAWTVFSFFLRLVLFVLQTAIAPFRALNANQRMWLHALPTNGTAECIGVVAHVASDGTLTSVTRADFACSAAQEMMGDIALAVIFLIVGVCIFICTWIKCCKL